MPLVHGDPAARISAKVCPITITREAFWSDETRVVLLVSELISRINSGLIQFTVGSRGNSKFWRCYRRVMMANVCTKE